MDNSSPSQSVSAAVFADDAAPDVRVNEASENVASLFARYIKNGAHVEYKAYEARVTTGIGGRRRAPNVWEFIENAVEGSGGFSNGAYLFPFKMEVETNQVSEKLARRMVEADYDRFPEHICNAGWDLIVSASDMIDRHATDGSQAAPLLSEFWQDVDGHGTSITDFLEYPQRQARMYGTGWIFIDRSQAELRTKADDLAPENRPYLYAVPTRNVVDWEFDDDGDLVGLVILEPAKMLPSSSDLSGTVTASTSPIRVWTPDAWAVYTTKPGVSGGNVAAYEMTESGVNTLGEIPVVMIHNNDPAPGHALGKSEMLDIARLAQTVYNIDSESREIERKCALFLAIPVKNTGDYDGGKIVLGTDSALAYDASSGKPEWISPNLDILARLDERRKLKKADAYQMAGLGALAGAVGVIQTRSGFHAEVEFSKTERRIARQAATLEKVEKRLAELYLRFYGIDPTAEPDLFSVTYPRDYGVRDMQKLIDDTIAVLDIGVGDDWEREELTRLARARFPRKAEKELTALVEGATKARSQNKLQANAVARVKQLAAQSQEVPKNVIPVDPQRKSDWATAQGGTEGG
jgi:hypothetical protein